MIELNINSMHELKKRINALIDGFQTTICIFSKKTDPLYDMDRYLPQDLNDTWWTPIEPINTVNRHLINVTRPIGVNTIGSRLGDRHTNLRDAPMIPAITVSPWLQSSFGPD